MRTLYFDEALIRSYYENEFADDLKRYFEISLNKNEGIHCILSMKHFHNPHRVIDGGPACKTNLLLELNTIRDKYETEKNFLFAGLYYFMILVPQTLRKMLGKEAEYSFYQCTGWPLSNAGLGGYLPPAQMLQEASLMPCEVEKENYCTMISMVSDFMIEEMRQFFSGENPANINQNAYNKLIATVTPKIEDILDSIDKDTKEFRESIKPCR